MTVDGGRLYLGTHDGRVLALDPANGATVWEFASGDSVLAAPAVAGGRVYFGSYDGNVYALDAAKGQLAWKHDTKGAVVSTPAVDPASGRVVIGSRSYDLLGLDAATGALAWKQYIWSSWVESSATLRDGVAYVGSSDAAALYAFDARIGPTPVGDRRARLGLGPARGDGPAASSSAPRPPRTTWSAIAAAPWPWTAPRASRRGASRPRRRIRAPTASRARPRWATGLVFLTGLDGRVYAFAQ